MVGGAPGHGMEINGQSMAGCLDLNYWAPGNKCRAGHQWREGLQLQGWFPRNQRLGLAGTQEIMAALRKSGTQCLGPRKTGNPAINGWAQMAQIKSMASKRS